jgi:hypothetical protein
MTATTTPIRVGEPVKRDTLSAALDASSQYKPKIWKGWTVGSYVQAWLPEHTPCTAPHGGQTGRKHPVLLVDIRKPAMGEAQFVVALLYDRSAAARRSRGLPWFARWIASMSLLRWPRTCTHVLSNDFELVYEWELATWYRSSPLSVATHWIIDARINRLAKYTISPASDVGRAMDTAPYFPRFLQLPREIRDLIYEHTLRDERQGLGQSRIYTHSLLLRRMYGKRNWPWYRDLCLPALDPLPLFHTPGILRVCKQVQSEALDTLYRTKVLVVTVTSAAADFSGLTQRWSLDMLRFRRIRVDLVLTSIAVEEIPVCFRRIGKLLEERARSLQTLEVRIGYSQVNASAVRDHNVALLFERQDDAAVMRRDIAESMRELLPLIQGQRHRESAGYQPLRVRWGVSQAHRKAGDYSCAYTYLRAGFLEPIWGEVCHQSGEESGKSDDAAGPSG